MDALRGALVLMVMMGHLAEITHSHGLALWVGSGFRMPMMVGLSGYLLNLPRIRSQPLSDLAAHYGLRLGLPWLFASIVYLLIAGWSPGWTLPLDLLLRPPFHLWYVPVLCFLVLVARVLPLSPLVLLAIGAPVSLTIMYMFGVNHGHVGQGLLAFDCRFLRYPLYFFLGVAIAQRRGTPRDAWAVAILAVVGVAWWAGRYQDDAPLADLAARLVMNVGLIALLPCVAAMRVRVPVLGTIGQASLFFYLWHPLLLGLALALALPPMLALLGAAAGLLVLCGQLAAKPALAALTGAAGTRSRAGAAGTGGGAALAPT